MKKITTISLFLVLTCLTAIPSFAQTTVTPMERLRAGVQGVIDILNNPEYKGVADRQNEKNTKVRDAIKDFFNFRELSKRTIGRPWLNFSSEEQDRFIFLFTQLLEETYLGKIGSYSSEKVSFDKETIIQDKYAQVDTRILSSSKSIPVVYRLKLIDDVWDVYDVKVEGISLVNNYRSQFAGILDTSSNDKFEASKKDLFERLDQKCQELKNKQNKK
ncbi:MlaC/ttg2D family ABC transporter substrate-binding protein [Desulfovibrio gilichinskyi]|uniref:Phospholipid transport system substrate-binding protein n=1 Tax=Desulfovibrio gilichinskyi TaxID=1519643 RepID=A0A1X7E574_9BACT|nr:ABC transporter substrate-binding protein [Desulfovibrio gilichinskyi]SMF27231.1 phospholipid transport system substrate-binding protein [Desulfovibrio gilichinskyi]